MKTAKTAVRFLGFCQICEAEQKLHGGKLVHHGYKRPGWGAIVGDCYGVGFLPYQKSCEQVKEYKAVLLDELEEKVAYRTKLEAKTVKSFWYVNYRKEGCLLAVGVTEQHTWERAFAAELSGTAWAIRGLEAEIERLTKRIAAWKLVETNERTERVSDAEKKAESDARKALRTAAREAKDAKAKALAEKREKTAQAQQAVRAEFFEKFEVLAKTCTNEDLVKAKALAIEMKKSKFKFITFYDYKHISRALLALGLATKDASGWINYHYPL